MMDDMEQQTLRGMAECMDMVRAELIEAGVVDASVPPMMLANAVLNFIARERAAARSPLSDVDARLPKWIDDQKGKDPGTDDLVHEIVRLNAELAALRRQMEQDWCPECHYRASHPEAATAVPEIEFAYLPNEPRRIMVASQEVVDGKLLVCVAIKGAAAHSADGAALGQMGKPDGRLTAPQQSAVDEALACIEFHAPAEVYRQVRAVLDTHFDRKYRAPVQVSLAGIHVARLYFDWSREGTGFGQLSIGKQEDGRVTCMNECMGRAFVRDALHAAIDALVDAAELEEK
ncbi:MAG: hypothetical protein ACXWVD_00375 [Telluria sp.]